MVGVLGRNLNHGNAVNWSNPANRGLWLWWLRLPGRSGGIGVRDLCGRYFGRFTNGPTWAGGPNGMSAVSMAGGDDRIDAGAHIGTPSGGTLVIDCLFRLMNGTSGNRTLASTYLGYPGDIQYTFRINNSAAVELFLRATGDNTISGGTVSADAWTTARAVIDDSAKTISVYLAGNLVAGPTGFSGSPASVTAEFAGGGSETGGEGFPGHIQSIRVQRYAGITPSNALARYVHHQSLRGFPDLLSRSPARFPYHTAGGGGGGAFMKLLGERFRLAGCGGLVG